MKPVRAFEKGRLIVDEKISLTLIKVQAGGGVVQQEKKGERQVLLIFRKGVWDLPKGKKEAGETIEECACREVAEETGIPMPKIERFLVKTFHQYKRNGQLYNKETYWFAMKRKGNTDFTPQKEEGITKVAWVEVTEAFKKVGYENLQKVLEEL